MKLQNGDYLPVSEIKTEQDFNDVVKAAKGCGFDIVSPLIDYQDLIEKAFATDVLYIGGGRLIPNNWNRPGPDSQLTLPQWLERGGISRDSCGVKPKDKTEQEWMPEVGEECLIRCTYDGITWHKSRKGFLKGVFNNELWMDVPVGGGDLILLRQNVKFKPLTTPEEVEREEFANGFSHDVMKVTEDNRKNFYTMGLNLFDLGYRKQE